MAVENWQVVKEIFNSALDFPADQRCQYLDQACGADSDLRHEVDSLLRSHDHAGDILETPAFELSDISDATSLDPYIGEFIGAYRVIQKIGEGGMGTVYRALRVDDQYVKQVAIKIVRIGVSSEHYVQQLKNERQIMASLEHPNIARLLDGGATPDGRPYIVMEYIEGCRIDEYCDRHHLKTADRLRMFLNVCSAVQYAHQHLVIHRDLKPGNILVTDEHCPKLLDFGIAKLLDPELFLQSGEATQTVLKPMTPEYASPEQVRGDTVTTATDVYSLGVLLYRLLTGHSPYRVQGGLVQTLRAITETDPEKPSSIIATVEQDTGHEGNTITLTPEAVSSTRDGEPELLRRRLSGDLDNIVLKALQKDPQQRYASVEQFALDIERHLQGMPVLARKDTLAYRTSKFLHRNRAAASAAVALFLTLVAGILMTAWQARRATQQQHIAEKRFDDVRSLATSLVFEVHDSIADLPGATPARKLLVSRALQYLDGLSKEASGDFSLQRDLAAAYQKVGDVQGNPDVSNLGDIHGALTSFGKELNILRALVKSDPGNLEVKRLLSDVYYRIGECQDAIGDFEGALQSSRTGLGLDQALADSNDPRDQDNLAGDYNNLGEKLLRTADLPGALENFRRAMSIHQSIVPNNPRRALMVKMHSGSDYDGAARALLASGDAAQALKMEAQAFAVLKQLSDKDPDNATLRFAVGQSYQSYGMILNQQKHPAEALSKYKQAIMIFEQVLKADPNNEIIRRYLAMADRDAGVLLAQSGSYAEGKQHLDRSVASFQELTRAEPDNTLVVSGLADTYSALAQIEQQQADRQSAALQQSCAHVLQSKEMWASLQKHNLLAPIDRDKARLVEANATRCTPSSSPNLISDNHPD